MGKIIKFSGSDSNKDLIGIIDDFLQSADASEDQDADRAIDNIQAHLQQLLWQRGRRDCRIFIVLLSALSFVAAMYLVNTLWFLLLIFVGSGVVYAGMRVNIMIERIDIEIAASNAILIELLKTKIMKRIVKH